jgi:hypothetical protein
MFLVREEKLFNQQTKKFVFVSLAQKIYLELAATSKILA